VIKKVHSVDGSRIAQRKPSHHSMLHGDSIQFENAGTMKTNCPYKFGKYNAFHIRELLAHNIEAFEPIPENRNTIRCEQPQICSE
jgi:hypothetical protein